MIQTAYGSKITIQQHQSSSVKSNRPKSAPMHRLSFANLQLQQQQHNEQTKKILQPSPTKKSAWISTKDKKNSNTKSKLSSTKKKIHVPVKKRGSNNMNNRLNRTNSSNINVSFASSTNSFGSTEMIYESNFIPSFRYNNNKHNTENGTTMNKSSSRPSSAPLHRLVKIVTR